MEYLHERNDKQQSFSAIQHIKITMLEFLHKPWLTRNYHLHWKYIQNAPSFKKLQLLQEMNEIYQRTSHMLANNRDILSKEIRTITHKTTYQLN